MYEFSSHNNKDTYKWNKIVTTDNQCYKTKGDNDEPS